MIQFKNIPHALATFFKAVVKDAPKVVAKTEQVIEGIEKNQGEIKAVSDIAAAAAGSAAGVGAAPAVAAVDLIESAAFAALGAIDAALKAGGAAAAQKLLDAGLDQAAIDAVKAAGTQSTAVYVAVQAATK